MGATLDPESAFLITRGMKTYYLRYRQHSANAQVIAEFLATLPEVERVHYPGLKTHPAHALAKNQMQDFGGVLSFDLKADKARTWAFIDALELFATTASLGSTDSLVAPARLYLGSDLTPEEQSRAGLKDSTVRLAVGIEDPEDLIADLTQALEKTLR
jgi:cystathionine beta-lyase/cystathionine gamma-synthase